LVLSVDRMEKTKDADVSAVKAVEREFGFPVISIANVREIFAAASRMVTLDGTPLLDDDTRHRADDYLSEYGA
jgi:orotate phosphoribosyltransferase